MPWMITLHIVFLVIWSGALIYMPRLFIDEAYSDNIESRKRAFVMQRALYSWVMTPSALLTVVAGSWLIFERGFEGGWFPAKLALVMLMVFFHAYCGRLMEELRLHHVRHRPIYYWSLPLVPLLLITGVVTLVVAKPF